MAAARRVLHIREPGEAEDSRREEEAAVEVRPRSRRTGASQAPRVRRDDRRGAGASTKQAIRGAAAEREGRCRDDERAEGQQRGGPNVETPSRQITNSDRRRSRPTRAARSTARPTQPPTRNTAVRTTWAPHCWSSHGSPGGVNVHVSTSGSPASRGSRRRPAGGRRGRSSRRGKQRREHGQRDGQERPEAGERHAAMLDGGGDCAHHPVSPAGSPELGRCDRCLWQVRGDARGQLEPQPPTRREPGDDGAA